MSYAMIYCPKPPIAYVIRNDFLTVFQVNPDGVAISEHGNELPLLWALGSIYWRSDNFGGKIRAGR